MRVKKLEWSEGRQGIHMTNNIPNLLYTIRLADEGKYAVRFYAGWTETEPKPLYQNTNINQCKIFADMHWSSYVEENFLKEA